MHAPYLLFSLTPKELLGMLGLVGKVERLSVCSPMGTGPKHASHTRTRARAHTHTHTHAHTHATQTDREHTHIHNTLYNACTYT